MFSGTPLTFPLEFFSYIIKSLQFLMGHNESYQHDPLQGSLRDFLLLFNLVGFKFSQYKKSKDDKSKQYYF